MMMMMSCSQNICIYGYMEKRGKKAGVFLSRSSIRQTEMLVIVLSGIYMDMELVEKGKKKWANILSFLRR